MSNYPNMSYCAFENTSRAMTQLITMISLAIEDDEPLDFNRDELSYYRSMFNKCQELMELIDQHNDLMANKKDHVD